MNNIDVKRKYDIDWIVRKAKENTLYILCESLENWYILIQSPYNETLFVGYHSSGKRTKPYANHVKTTKMPKTKEHIIFIENNKINNYINSERIYDDYQACFSNCNFYVVPESNKLKLLEIDSNLYKELNVDNISAYASTFPDEINNSNKYYEGAVEKVIVNKYERSAVAKKKCLKHYGTQCKICGFKFSDKYGKEFKNKIHIHHIKPISEIGEEYKIDPINDLIPVCPNCHMILHSKGKNQVYTVEEVKNMIERNL